MARMKIKISDKDKGWNKLMSQFLSKTQAATVDTGILVETDGPKMNLKGEATNSSLMEVAIANEFGTSTIPSRSFIREPFDRTEGYVKLRKSLWKRVINGEIDLSQALHILGSATVKSFQKTIKNVILPLNADSTIRAKQESSAQSIPLIATGQLLNSISYRVNKK